MDKSQDSAERQREDDDVAAEKKAKTSTQEESMMGQRMGDKAAEQSTPLLNGGLQRIILVGGALRAPMLAAGACSSFSALALAALSYTTAASWVARALPPPASSAHCRAPHLLADAPLLSPMCTMNLA